MSVSNKLVIIGSNNIFFSSIFRNDHFYASTRPACYFSFHGLLCARLLLYYNSVAVLTTILWKNGACGMKYAFCYKEKRLPFSEASPYLMLYYFCNCWVISVLSFPLIPSASSAWSNVHFMLFMRF